MTHIDYRHSLKDAVVAGVLTLIVFSPITNFILNQYQVDIEWMRMPPFLNGIFIALFVAIMRFFVSVMIQTPSGQRFTQRYLRRTHQVEVVDSYAGGMKSLWALLPMVGIIALTVLVLAVLGLLPVAMACAIGLVLLYVVIAQGVRIPYIRGKAHPWKHVLPVLFILGWIAPFALFYFGLLNKAWLNTLNLAMIYVLLGLGLNIVVGLAGLLDLGFVAFYAVGAYFLALGAEYLGIGFWTALIIAPFLAALCGGLLGFPVLKMHGDYLAIVTLGFGEIIRLVLTNWTSFTHGPNGLNAPSPTLMGLEFSRRATQGGTPFHEFFGLKYSSDYKMLFFYALLFLVSFVLLRLFTQLRVMPIGRSWEALREDEIACRSLGINHVTVKLSAFMMGAFCGGVAGVFFASSQGFISPMSFNFLESVMILAMVVLGGMGSSIGVIVAAFVLVFMQEGLREVQEYRVVIFGLLMILIMIWRPNGLLRTKRPVLHRTEGETA